MIFKIMLIKNKIFLSVAGIALLLALVFLLKGSLAQLPPEGGTETPTTITTFVQPTAVPPYNNVSAPINTGPEEQTKLGKINLQELNFKGLDFNIVYLNTVEDTYNNFKCYYCRKIDLKKLKPPIKEVEAPGPKCLMVNPDGSFTQRFIRLTKNECNLDLMTAYSCPTDVSRSCYDYYRDDGCPYPPIWGHGELIGFRGREVNCVKHGFLMPQQ
jgi:hypothetical protein